MVSSAGSKAARGETGGDLNASPRENRLQGRLGEGRRTKAREKAAAAQKKLIALARKRMSADVQEGQGLFFLMLFQLAGESIENDVDSFCDRAEMAFEEIEAHGQEPVLDDDWLGEVTGDRDTFNFSTDNLVSDLVSPPRKKRRQKKLSQEERDRLIAEVENAIIDDDHDTGEEEQDFEQALAVAHVENVNDWIEKIKIALQASEDGILEFWTLKKKTGLRPTELFLGILLGQKHWKIGQKEFYGKVLVRMREKDEELKEQDQEKRVLETKEDK